MNSSIDALWILAHRTPEPASRSPSPRVASGLLSLLGAFEKLDLPVRWWNPGCLVESHVPGLEEALRGHQEFSNRVLWPLCHNVGIRPVRTNENAKAYRDINEKIASAIALELKRTSAHPLLLIHDFHFAGVPGMLRNLGVRNPIGFFWHIPFPEAREFGRIPEAKAIIQSLAQTDALGVHTQADAERHAACQRAFGQGSVPRGGVHILPAAPERTRVNRQQEISRSVGRRTAILGIDRMDYTKGLIQKFEAVNRVLESRPHLRGRLQLVQVAAPTRSELPEYRTHATKVRQLAERINSRWAISDAPRHRVILLLEKVLSPRQMAALHAHADIALITPLRDGMNLVAKEHVLVRFATGSPPAAMVLSRQAGAAEELGNAHLVNATDPDDIARGIREALDEPVTEKLSRMAALHAVVQVRDATHWAQGLVGATLRAAYGQGGSGQQTGIVIPLTHEPQEAALPLPPRIRLSGNHRLRSLSPAPKPLPTDCDRKAEGLSD